jgi:hypothetical protein
MPFRFVGRATYSTDLGKPIDLPWSVDVSLIRLDIKSDLGDRRSWKKVGGLNLLLSDGGTKYPINIYKRLIFGTQVIEPNSPIFPYGLQVVPVYYLPEFTISLYKFEPI